MPNSCPNRAAGGANESMPLHLPQGARPFRRKPVHSGGVHVHVEVFEPNDVGPHQHVQWQLTILPPHTAFEATWQAPRERKQKRRLVGGDVWLLPPGWIHSLRWREPTEAVILYIDDARIRQYCPDLSRAISSISRLTEYAAGVAGIAELYREVRSFAKQPNGPGDWRLATAASHLASSLLYAHTLLTEGIFKAPSVLIATIIDKLNHHLKNHLNERLHLGAISRSLGVSDRHLRRLFRIEKGVSPQEWIMIRKAESAVRWLSEGKSVKETVERAGFTGESHMRRVVVRIYGVSPAAFRKRAQTALANRA